jgi:chemotaxis protein methyltransferase CheR
MNAPSRREPMIPGEFLLCREDFKQISGMIYHDAGIHLSESKAALVYARLAKRMRALRLRAFSDYCELLAGPDGAGERQEMLTALTTNVTRFFREPHHFEHLRTRVLPPLLAIGSRGGRARFWSAACSSGQEPYSIALTILSAWPQAVEHDVKVLATDIDPAMIAAGREGVYNEEQLEGVTSEQRKRFFEPARVDDKPAWRAGEALRRLVAFRPLNLVQDWPMRGAFHAIFCRNVVIYFDEPTQQRVWDRFVPRLEEDAYLYIGHSERVTGAATARFRGEGGSTYRLTGGERR